jgi:hypothetical protein
MISNAGTLLNSHKVGIIHQGTCLSSGVVSSTIEVRDLCEWVGMDLLRQGIRFTRLFAYGCQDGTIRSMYLLGS